jgi:hypothetical protein
LITLRVLITDYDKTTNTCKGELLNGDIIYIDPFVSCALPLSDADYHLGKGANIIGKEYLLTHYTVYKDNVVPHENGIIEI